MDTRLTSLIIPINARLIDAVQVIEDNKSRCAIVTSHEKVMGVISEGDIMRALLQGADIHSSLESWISHGFKFLTAVDHAEALALMRMHGITLVPVIGEDFHLCDVIMLSDVLNRVELAI